MADEEDEDPDAETPTFDGEEVQGGEPSPDKDGTTEELTGDE